MDAVIKEFDFFSANHHHQDNKDAPSNVDVSACFLTLEIDHLMRFQKVDLCFWKVESQSLYRIWYDV